MIIGNVGNVPVDYLTVAISESYNDHIRRTDEAAEAGSLESAYERDVFDHGTRAFWVQDFVDGVNPRGSDSSMPKRIKVNIEPGESHTVIVGVFGKKYSSGCTFLV